MFALVFLALFQSYAFAQFPFYQGPILPDATVFSAETTTVAITKGTPCFHTTESVTECRRKRGIQETPQVSPSHISKVEPTVTALLDVHQLGKRSVDSETMLSSSLMDLSSFHRQQPLNVFRQLAHLGRGGNNVVSISVGCGGSTLNYSQFLSCLGMTIQRTTILTATYTVKTTVFSGYNTVSLAGCTPADFVLPSCDDLTSTSTTEMTSSSTTETTSQSTAETTSPSTTETTSPSTTTSSTTISAAKPFDISRCTELTTSSGDIQSPQHPEPYPDNTNVCWFIDARSTIVFEYGTFDTTKDSDQLEFFDGDSPDTSRLLNMLTGNLISGGISITPPSTKALIRFTTGPNSSKQKGFQLSYRPENK